MPGSLPGARDSETNKTYTCPFVLNGKQTGKETMTKKWDEPREFEKCSLLREHAERVPCLLTGKGLREDSCRSQVLKGEQEVAR